ncbi:Cocaine esterase [Bulinus truncatus]|nr:Cocaine esterase [Bulinus truncatus]
MRATLLAALCTLLLQSTVAAPAITTTTIKTHLGPVKGISAHAANNQSYWSFLGIPYAQPPIGKLRFAKPQPLTYSDNVIDATRYGAACIQERFILAPSETISEDCLFLNVFTKDLSGKVKKVLVWFHGGAFIVGSSYSYNPGSLVTSENIIVVTVNYRLGILGFLSTEDSVSPGNYGLWDQILAIKWVKRNIEAFGGDPNDITIAGESAGGSTVSLLSLSPVTKGLFTKVYSHSGFATTLSAQYKRAKTDALNLGRALNCSQINVSTRDVIDCLRSKPASSLVGNMDLFRSIWAPREDGDLMPKSPLQLVNDREYLQRIGFYDRDYFLAINNNEATVINLRYIPEKTMFYGRSNKSRGETDAIWKKMMVDANVAGRLEIENPNSKLVDLVSSWYDNRFVDQDVGYSTLLTDVNFIIPAFDILNAASQNKKTRVWLLYFNYYPSYLTGSTRGTSHGFDISYWFDPPTSIFNEVAFSNTDIEIKKMYSSIVADFVKGKGESSLWRRYDPVGDYYLDFNAHPTVMSHLVWDSRRLWKTELPEMFASLQSARCD